MTAVELFLYFVALTNLGWAVSLVMRRELSLSARLLLGLAVYPFWPMILGSYSKLYPLPTLAPLLFFLLPRLRHHPAVALHAPGEPLHAPAAA